MVRFMALCCLDVCPHQNVSLQTYNFAKIMQHISVIRKKKISKRVFQETKARKMFGKTNIFNHLIRTRTCAYQGVRNVHFSENLASLVFLKHLFWNSAFCLINDDLPVSCICSKNYLESPLKRACCLNILKHCSIFI